LINSGAAATWSGAITLASDASIVSNNNISLTAATSVTGAFNLTLGGTATGSSITGIIGTTTGGVTKTGTGTWTLNGANTYTGGTTISVGTLALGHATNTLADTGAVNVNGGTLSIGGNSDTVGAVTLSSGSITGSGGTLTGSSYAVQSGSVSAILGGTGALTKSTAGTVTLTGANTYSGLTTISAGKLLVNNTVGSGTGTGTVSVGASGTLGGTGAISGAVNVTGQLSPGASIETFATGTLSMANGSTLVHELDSFVADAVGSDLLEVTGNLNLTGTVYLTLEDLAVTDEAFAVNDMFSLINYTGSWNNGLFTFGGELLSDEEVFSFGLNTWKISYNDAEGGLNYTGEFAGGTDSFVNLTAVTIIPEPGTALLSGLGVLLMFRRRR
jgi:autotransporter-associated beta strand protein